MLDILELTKDERSVYKIYRKLKRELKGQKTTALVWLKMNYNTCLTFQGDAILLHTFTNFEIYPRSCKGERLLVCRFEGDAMDAVLEMYERIDVGVVVATIGRDEEDCERDMENWREI